MANQILGVDNEILYLHDQEAFYSVILSMSRQAKQHIRLFSHDLDRSLFNTLEMVEAFTQLATSSANAYIQILLQNTSSMISQGHRMLELARSFSSFVEIRVADTMHQHISENFYLFDDSAWVNRKYPDQYQGEANFHDARSVRDFEHRYKNMWERAIPDPDLRRMTI